MWKIFPFDDVIISYNFRWSTHDFRESTWPQTWVIKQRISMTEAFRSVMENLTIIKCSCLRTVSCMWFGLWYIQHVLQSFIVVRSACPWSRLDSRRSCRVQSGFQTMRGVSERAGVLPSAARSHSACSRTRHRSLHDHHRNARGRSSVSSAPSWVPRGRLSWRHHWRKCLCARAVRCLDSALLQLWWCRLCWCLPLVWLWRKRWKWRTVGQRVSWLGLKDNGNISGGVKVFKHKERAASSDKPVVPMTSLEWKQQMYRGEDKHRGSAVVANIAILLNQNCEPFT